MEIKKLPDYGIVIKGELYELVETESVDECAECALHAHCDRILDDDGEGTYICEAVLGEIQIGVNFKKWRL